MKRSLTVFDAFGKIRWVIMLGCDRHDAGGQCGHRVRANRHSARCAEDRRLRPATRRLSLNVLWVLIAAALVFFMQAGFALVETGFTRNKNVVHTMMMNMMVFCIGALGYWLVGFAFQFGGVNLHLSRHQWQSRMELRAGDTGRLGRVCSISP